MELITAPSCGNSPLLLKIQTLLLIEKKEQEVESEVFQTGLMELEQLLPGRSDELWYMPLTSRKVPAIIKLQFSLDEYF